MQPNEMTVLGITLPTIIVAALMGSALTLLGVFLQNLFENYRNNKKLKHEAGQKNRDREMTLRRDVYLEAASEMARAARYIAKFDKTFIRPTVWRIKWQPREFQF